MCHGAGGLAGHVKIGDGRRARHPWRGAATDRDILQRLRWEFLRLFPPSVLGVILFLTGAQLALGAGDISMDKGERFAMMVNAALSAWNVGIAFPAGLKAYGSTRNGLLRV